MAFVSGAWRRVLPGFGFLALFAPGISQAQVPPEAAETTTCLCLQQAMAAASAEMNAKNQAFNSVDRQVNDLTAQVNSERPTINVNNPDAVARFKALLERRDALSQSVDPAHAGAAQAVIRYNTLVNQYNARCLNPAVTAAMQAHLVCPPPAIGR